MDARQRAHRQSTLVAVTGVAAVVLYAGWAALQIFVLNPLAAAPGRDLGEVYAEMDAVGETMPYLMPLGVLGLGVGIAVFTAVTSIRSRLDPAVTALLFLALLTAGAPAYFIASFGPGMSLADAFMISGGDISGGAKPLYALSLLAAVAAAVLGVWIARLAPSARAASVSQ